MQSDAKRLVAVRRSVPDVGRAVADVFDALPIPDLTGKKILLKPNLGRLAENDRGIITRTPVIAAVIAWFKAKGYDDLAIGDSPILGLKSADIFARTGVDKLAAETGVTLLDFDGVAPTVTDIAAGTVLRQVKLVGCLKEFDYLVDIPVAKMHMHTSVSLSLKNLKGCIWRADKVRLHQLTAAEQESGGAKPLDIAIADLSRVITPDLTLIDATIAQEGMGPAAGSPRPMNLVIGSCDYLDADLIAAQLMGIDPAGIHHLRLARALAGKRMAVDFPVDPAAYLDWRVELSPAPAELELAFPGVDIDAKQACSACMSTLLLFLKAYLPAVELERLPDETLRVKVGKGVLPGGEKVIFLGNCTKQAAGADGIYVKGCPPVSSHIFAILKERGLIKGEFCQKNL